MTMLRLGRKRVNLALLGVGVVYVFLLVANLSARERRSLDLHADGRAADSVLVSMRILSADLTSGDVRAAMNFQLRGKIAIDAATPAVDLKLLLNTRRGPQEVDFPKGRRLNPVEAVFNVRGEPDWYPFDKHRAQLAFTLITEPGRARSPARVSPSGATTRVSPSTGTTPAPATDAGNVGPVLRLFKGPNPGAPTGTASATSPPDSGETIEDDKLGFSKFEGNSVPIEVDLSASVPGVDFERMSKEGTSEIGFLGDSAIVTLYMRRANNVIATSVFVSVLMMGLALSVLAMVMQATVMGKESTLLPLSLSVSLIFGLPALRNMQPNVPALGALNDYYSYIIAEMIVAISTIVVVWTWIVRSRPEEAEQTDQPERPASE